jgi:hypothetical protein
MPDAPPEVVNENNQLADPFGSNVDIDPKTFIQKITDEEMERVRLDKASQIILNQQSIKGSDIDSLLNNCTLGNCHENLLCQPSRLLEIDPMYEISSKMFQSSVIESNSNVFIFTFSFCLSIKEIIFVKELAELMKNDISVFVYDVSLNELELVDISGNYGKQKGLIFLQGRTKPFVLDLKSSIQMIDSEQKRKLFVESLQRTIQNVIQKNQKTEEF